MITEKTQAALAAAHAALDAKRRELQTSKGDQDDFVEQLEEITLTINEITITPVAPTE